MPLTIDQILQAKPNSKEMQIVKTYLEARDRAETLHKDNKELEKKVDAMRNQVMESSREKYDAQEKYSQ